MTHLLGQLGNVVSRALQPTVKIYESQFSPFTDGRSPWFVCIADEKSIRKIIPLAELQSDFGGFIRFRHRTNTRKSYLGVWSVRKASKYRRLLRERGAIVERVHSFPSNIRVATISTTRGSSSFVKR